MLVDTHCHLDFPEFDADRDEVIQNAQSKGIGYIINIGATLESSRNSVELASKYESLYAAVGVHPHDADKFTQDIGLKISELTAKKKVVAIGEIGLDFYKNYSKPENQLPLFVSLLKIAKDMDLPLVIHTRQAQDETLKILKDAMPVRAVVHCFSGDAEFLQACLDLGFYISYTCNITYKKAQNLRDMVKLTPFERLVLETDCPYLSPEGQRGRRNVPLNIKVLAEEVSRIKGISLEEVANITTANAFKFFNLK